MIIIWGIRSRKIRGPVVEDMICQRCGGTVHAILGMIDYFHIFWIPLIPFRRRVARVCLICKYAQIHKEIPQEERHRLTEVTIQGKHMVQTFIVPTILLGLFAFALLAGLVTR